MAAAVQVVGVVLLVVMERRMTKVLMVLEMAEME